MSKINQFPSQPQKPYQVYSKPGLTWVNITSPTKETLAEVKTRFPFLLDIDLRDCLPPYQRPKLVERREYLFMVFLFPVYRDQTRRIRIAEVDTFIGPDFVITSHTDELRSLKEMAKCYDQSSLVCPPENLNNPADWLHTILHGLLQGCFPMLNHVANDIDGLERELFSDADKTETVRDILRIKSNVVDFRQAMQGHKRVIEKLIDAAPRIIKLDGMKIYYEDLVGQTKEIWDFLENDKNTVDAIYDSYTSLVSHETNQAIKGLSAMSLIIFPCTLVAAIFAMDSDHMPIRGFIGDWWIMLGCVTATAAVVLYFMKKKQWL